MRQIEVLRQLADGNTMRVISKMLGVKERTIAYHKYRIMEVLGIKRNAALILYAVKNGIVSEE